MIRFLRSVRAALLPALLCLGAFAANAHAGGGPSTPAIDIASSGTLDNIYLGNELSCQVTIGGELQVYPTYTVPGDCGTFVSDGTTQYASDFLHHNGDDSTSSGFDPGPSTPWTPVSQTEVTGSGTSADPYSVTTVVRGGTEFEVTQTETYVVGDDFWSVKVTVKNIGEVATTARITRGLDCFLGGSDEGYGFVDSASGGVGCSVNPGNDPAAFIEALIPAAGQGVHYFEGYYDDNWTAIASQQQLPDSCDCGSQIDNGVSIQWDRSLAAGASATVAFRQVFSPNGVIPSPPANPSLPPVSTSPPTTPAGATVGAPVTADPGVWNDGTTVARQWQRCPTTELATCVDIAGADGLSYTPTAADQGGFVRYLERGTNANGTTTAAAQLIAVPAAPAAANPPGAKPPAGPAAACVSLRMMTVHWRIPGASKPKSQQATVNGKRLSKLTARSRQSAVDLRGMPLGTFTLRVDAHLSNGKHVTATRIYHTCAVVPMAPTFKTLVLR